MNYKNKTLEEMIERKIELIDELIEVTRAVYAMKAVHGSWSEVLERQKGVESILSGVWGDEDYKAANQFEEDIETESKKTS